MPVAEPVRIDRFTRARRGCWGTAATARDERVVDDLRRDRHGYADRLARRAGRQAVRPLAAGAPGRRGRATGPVADVGCGPGQVGAFVALAGEADVTGFDLSPAMVDEARAASPSCASRWPTCAALPAPDHGDGWALIVGLVLAHPPRRRPELPRPSLRWPAALRPGGTLAIAVHVGGEDRHLDEWFDQPVDIDFRLHDPGDVLAPSAAGPRRTSSGTPRPVPAGRPRPTGSTWSPTPL